MLGWVVLGSIGILLFAAAEAHAATASFGSTPVIIGADILSKLPQPVQNLIRSSQGLNEQLKIGSFSPQSFKGGGERIGETLRVTFRQFGFIILTILSWIVSAATTLVFWIAGITIFVINWYSTTIKP